jgi:hypothetical protein
MIPPSVIERETALVLRPGPTTICSGLPVRASERVEKYPSLRRLMLYRPAGRLGKMNLPSPSVAAVSWPAVSVNPAGPPVRVTATPLMRLFAVLPLHKTFDRPFASLSNLTTDSNRERRSGGCGYLSKRQLAGSQEGAFSSIYNYRTPGPM